MVFNSQKIFNKSNIYLFLFVLFCLATLFAIKLGDFYLNIFVRCARYLFLFLYYKSLVKKANYLLVSIIVLFFIASLFFVFNSSSLYGLVSICISRVVLIILIVSNIKLRGVSWNLAIKIFVLFTVIGSVILSLYYNNSPFFYLTVVSVIFLIILLALSFLNLLDTSLKGNLEFFSAISLFVISDTIFGVQRLTHVAIPFLVAASIFYNLAYFFIVKSEIKRQGLLRF